MIGFVFFPVDRTVVPVTDPTLAALARATVFAQTTGGVLYCWMYVDLDETVGTNKPRADVDLCKR